MARRSVIIIAAWTLLGSADFLLKAAWYDGAGLEFDAGYWAFMKALLFLPWALYTLLVFRIVDKNPYLAQINILGLGMHGVLGTLLIVVHPVIVAFGMVGYGVAGAAAATFGDVYRDVFLAMVLRDGFAIVGVWLTVTLLEFAQRLRAAEVSQPSAERNPRTLILNKRNGTAILPLADVDWIRAAGNYSEIYIRGDTHLTRESIGQISDRLDPRQFLRVHRSALVNRDKIKALNKTRQGWLVVLENAKTLPVSRRRVAELRELINA